MILCRTYVDDQFIGAFPSKASDGVLLKVLKTPWNVCADNVRAPSLQTCAAVPAMSPLHSIYTLAGQAEIIIVSVLRGRDTPDLSNENKHNPAVELRKDAQKSPMRACRRLQDAQFYRRVYGSLNSPACSCVSIMLPALS